MTAERLRPQRRKRHLAMTRSEVDEFLESEHTCRVATLNARGPHLSALWFIWDGQAMWLYSLTRSQRWQDLLADPRVAVLVDAGEEYSRLRGVELSGTAEVVGEVPRAGEPHPELEELERRFARKYFGGADIGHDQRHAWLRIVPEKITSWDFRKLTPSSPTTSGEAR